MASQQKTLQELMTPVGFTDSSAKSTSNTSSSTTSKRVLDEQLVRTIMSGLMGQMTDKEIAKYAEDLLRPQLNAGIEASQQNYETTKLSKQQEIENLSASLARSILEQEGAYRKGMADVENAALARGMGRSSYTLDTLANTGRAYADVIRQMTEEAGRQQGQIQAQITQAAQQNAQTQGRLNKDYASTLAAKMQELRQNQQTAYNQNYMTAISAAMGSQSNTASKTEGENSSLSISGQFAPSDTGSDYTPSASSKNSNLRLTQKV